tara:strand:- start:536 stop:766 length:231 start_codon:yes stop_codon:yes gene_type:complete
MLRQSSGSVFHIGRDGGTSHGEKLPTELESGIMKNNFVKRKKINATIKYEDNIKVSNWENKHLTRKKFNLNGRFVN